MKRSWPISDRMVIPCLLTALACVGLFALGSSSDVSAAEPRRVLLLHAFGHPYSPWSDMAASFRAELVKQSPDPTDLYEVSLDTARIQDPKDEGPFVEYIRALVSGRKLDLIVPVGAPAAFFMQRHRSQLYPATPMLILGAEVRRIPNASLTKNDTAVLLQEDIGAYLENILRLRPETTEVAVVEGNSPVERYWAAELRQDFQPWAGRVHFSWFNDLTFGEMLHRAATMPAHSAILWAMLSEDAAGVPYSQDRALTAMREVTNAPIFGIGDYELGRGIVGGPLMQTQSLGQEGAHVALRILKGEPPGDIKPLLVNSRLPMYDWRELRRWGIRENLLPRGSVIQYREPNVWQRYRWQILSAVALILLEAALIISLLIERRRRHQAELESQSRLSELAHMNRRSTVGELSASVAHELQQPLTAILSNIEAVELILSRLPNVGDVQDILADIKRDDLRASEVIKRLRRLLKKTSPEFQEIDLNDVVSDVFELLSAQASTRGVALSTSLALRAPRVSGDRIQLQQVVLNLVMNALDAMSSVNAAERKVIARTTLIDGASAEVSIEDSGPGIAPAKVEQLFEPFFTTKEAGMGMGLAISRTIVESHSGRIWAENREGAGGAAFRFRLPLVESGVKVDAELPGMDNAVASSERS